MKNVIPFLKKIKKNNNKGWFDDHKHEYLIAKDEFTLFVTEIVNLLSKKDKRLAAIDPAKCVFRIYRDVRFSKDKTPYKTHFGASINPDGKTAASPGYYIHLEPGDCFIVSGIYRPDGPSLAKIRQEIDYHLPEFKKILALPNLKKSFGGLSEEDKGKTVPRGFAKDNPAIELLKFKSYILVREINEKDCTKPGLAKELSAHLINAMPLNDFLGRSLT